MSKNPNTNPNHDTGPNPKTDLTAHLAACMGGRVHRHFYALDTQLAFFFKCIWYQLTHPHSSIKLVQECCVELICTTQLFSCTSFVHGTEEHRCPPGT